MALNTAQLIVKFTASQSGANDLGTPSFVPTLSKTLAYTNGTAADKADLLFMDERSVNSASNDDIDLAGVLADVYGSTITAAEIVGMIISSAAANTTTLTIGAGSNPWITWLAATGDGIKVPPGGVFCLFGKDATALGAVTAGTGDILRVANGSGAAATYEIAILGRSA